MYKSDQHPFQKPQGNYLSNLILHWQRYNALVVVKNSIPSWLKILTSTIPLLTADADTSMMKKYDGGIGGRTIYSVGAINSTLPVVSSGR